MTSQPVTQSRLFRNGHGRPPKLDERRSGLSVSEDHVMCC